MLVKATKEFNLIYHFFKIFNHPKLINCHYNNFVRNIGNLNLDIFVIHTAILVL